MKRNVEQGQGCPLPNRLKGLITVRDHDVCLRLCGEICLVSARYAAFICLRHIFIGLLPAVVGGLLRSWRKRPLRHPIHDDIKVVKKLLQIAAPVLTDGEEVPAFPLPHEAQPSSVEVKAHVLHRIKSQTVRMDSVEIPAAPVCQSLVGIRLVGIEVHTHQVIKVDIL